MHREAGDRSGGAAARAPPCASPYISADLPTSLGVSLCPPMSLDVSLCLSQARLHAHFPVYGDITPRITSASVEVTLTPNRNPNPTFTLTLTLAL